MLRPSVEPFIKRGFTLSPNRETGDKLTRAMPLPNSHFKLSYKVLDPIAKRLRDLAPKVLGEKAGRKEKMFEYRSEWDAIQNLIHNPLDLAISDARLISTGDKLLHLFRLIEGDGLIPRKHYGIEAGNGVDAMLLQLCCLVDPDTIPNLIKAHLWTQGRTGPEDKLVSNPDAPNSFLRDLHLTDEQFFWIQNTFTFITMMHDAGALFPFLYYMQKLAPQLTTDANRRVLEDLYDNARGCIGDEEYAARMICVETVYDDDMRAFMDEIPHGNRCLGLRF